MANPEYGTCGKCKREYDTEQGYLNHECPVTEYTPTDPEHHGEEFIVQSIEALKRGGSSEDDPEVEELKGKKEEAHLVSNATRQANLKQQEAKRKGIAYDPEAARKALPEQAKGKAKGKGKNKGKARGKS